MNKLELSEYLQSLKPDLRINTIRAYGTQLRSIAKALKLEMNPELFMKNKNLILKHMKSMDHRKRKLLISALLLFLSKFMTKEFAENIRAIMYEDIKLTKEEEKQQEMTATQKANWMKWDHILSVRDALAEQAVPLIKKKTVNLIQFNRIIDYIIVCLYTYQPPRRLDYKDMRPYGFPQKDVKEEDNFIDVKKGTFVFQNYKTKGSFDDQTIKINPELLSILKEYSKVKLPFIVEDDSDKWLLYDTKGKKFTSSKLSQRIGVIFNKPNFSSNMLRHIYISDVLLPEQEKMTKLEEEAYKMGHSLQTQQLYKKFNDDDIKKEDKK